MDLLLSGFADRYLHTLGPEELDEFEALLNLPDPDLYAWISGMAEVPDEHDSNVLRRLMAFNLEPADYRAC